jgi:NAD+ synthase (glutamine-hydrolysing)
LRKFEAYLAVFANFARQTQQSRIQYNMNNDFFRAVAASPQVNVADVEANVQNIIAAIEEVASKEVDVVVFPEMCVTGYTCGDLFHNSELLKRADDGLCHIAAATVSRQFAVVVGAPVRYGSALYNCAVVLADGRVRAAIPKTYLPNYNEFYEKRWWSVLPADANGLTANICGEEVPFGTDVLLQVGDAVVGVEICEDMWTPIPPSCRAALAGAEVILNLSASDDLIGKYDYLLSLIKQQSARCLCGYVYASAGYGESSTDLAFDAKDIVAENGSLLACNERWQHGNQYSIADIDLAAIRRDRMHIGSFNDCRDRNVPQGYRLVAVSKGCEHSDAMAYRSINPRPFVPSDDSRLKERCDEIISIQVAGLCRRLDFTHCKSLVVGISGGLDSTLALLVAVAAFDKLGLPRTGVTGVTMPGFGTTDRTYNNAINLMRQLGVTIREISIVKAVNQHFSDIGHDAENHDVTYENSQARERTQLLMDIANQTNGMVLGTGDLSELALGWATYNGDHMSMYGVNAGVPKTLVRHLVGYFATVTDDEQVRLTLNDIIDTPISPELSPAAADGTIKQVTEDLVGPYELHDFFLYYMLRYGFTPRRVYSMALKAFAGSYEVETIRKWIRVFYRRFFMQQFKRSCLPDGPKVGSVCLSPRGDWRMPSDASSALWLRECDEL